MLPKPRSYLEGVKLTPEMQEKVLSVMKWARQIARAHSFALLRSLGRRPAGFAQMLEDAEQEAMLGACRAAFDHDPTKGAMSTYSWWHIRQALQRGRSFWTCMADTLGPRFRSGRRSARKAHRFYMISDFDKGQTNDEMPFDISDDGRQDVLRRLYEAALDEETLALLRSVVPQRWWDIVWKRMNGDTLETIGREFGVTRERIRQIEVAALHRFRLVNRIRGMIEAEDV